MVSSKGANKSKMAHKKENTFEEKSGVSVTNWRILPTDELQKKLAGNPCLAVANKKVRALKKKMEKIRQLEEFIREGKELNEDQEEVLSHKASILKLFSEFDALRGQMMDTHFENEAKLEAAKKEKEAEVVCDERPETLEAETVKEAAVVVEETESPDVAQVAEASQTDAMEIDTSIPTNQEEVSSSPSSPTPSVDLSFEVERLLRVFHVANRCEISGTPLPTPIDFFLQTLLGKTCPPHERTFSDNLADSLACAMRFMNRSEQEVVNECTFEQLEKIVLSLAPQPVVESKAEEPVVEDVPVEPEAPAEPTFNFFADDSPVEPTEVVVEPVEVAPVEEPVEETAAPVVEETEAPVVEAKKEEVVVEASVSQEVAERTQEPELKAVTIPETEVKFKDPAEGTSSPTSPSSDSSGGATPPPSAAAPVVRNGGGRRRTRGRRGGGGGANSAQQKPVVQQQQKPVVQQQQKPVVQQQQKPVVQQQQPVQRMQGVTRQQAMMQSKPVQRPVLRPPVVQQQQAVQRSQVMQQHPNGQQRVMQRQQPMADSVQQQQQVRPRLQNQRFPRGPQRVPPQPMQTGVIGANRAVGPVGAVGNAFVRQNTAVRPNHMGGGMGAPNAPRPRLGHRAGAGMNRAPIRPRGPVGVPVGPANIAASTN